MDIEKALLDQNLVLGEIKGLVTSVKDLQTTANGRTDKLENRVTLLEKANDERIRALETAKDVMDGRLQAIKWVWGGIWALTVVIMGLVEYFVKKP